MLISKKNEVYLILDDLDPSTSQELTEFFTFEVPGFKFMPMYRNRMWDGKIRLFSPGSGEIYVGLLPYIKQFCFRNKIEFNPHPNAIGTWFKFQPNLIIEPIPFIISIG